MAEKSKVCRFVEILTDPAHVGQKTHIQHPVHFVEHENFYLFKTHRPLLSDPAGVPVLHQNVDAALHCIIVSL